MISLSKWNRKTEYLQEEEKLSDKIDLFGG